MLPSRGRQDASVAFASSMYLLPPHFAALGQALASLALTVLLVLLVRSIWRVSRVLGLLAAVVIAIRAGLGLAMLAISSWDLDFLRGQHTGDGFWVQALDSRVYYSTALLGAAEGPWAIAPGSASPAYTRLLGLWLWVFGPWHFAAIALNAVVYLVMMWVVARTCLTGARQAPLTGVLLSMTAVSLSPTLTFCSTQVLKDVLFVALLVMMVATFRWWLPHLRMCLAGLRPSLALATGWLALLGNMAVIAGVRVYYCVFLFLGFTAALATVVPSRSLKRVVSRVAVVVVVLASLWGAFAVGGGVYYATYGQMADDLVTRVTGVRPSRMFAAIDDGAREEAPVLAALDSARSGFVASGGNSNLASQPATAADPETTGAPSPQGQSRLRSTAVGIAVTFLPLAVLEPLGVVNLPMGRFAGLVSDLDTVFVLVSLAMVGLFLRSVIGHADVDRALLTFLLVVGPVAIVLVAYVVTNAGTLTRLRVPALAFFWLLPLAVSVRSHRMGANIDI